MPYAQPNGGLSQNPKGVDGEIEVSQSSYIDAMKKIKGVDEKPYKMTLVDGEMAFYRAPVVAFDGEEFVGMVANHIHGQPLVTDAPDKSFVKPVYDNGEWIEGDPEGASQQHKQREKARIDAELDRIDAKLIRSTIEILGKTDKKEDRDIHDELKAQKEALRAERAAL